MANDNKSGKKGNQQHGGGAGGFDANQCKSEDCQKKPWKFGFCEEHYELFMAGVLRGDGKKPVDWEQKLQHYHAKKKAS